MPTAYRSSVSANTGAAAASSLTVTLPAGIQTHDVLIATITHDANASSTMSTPSGWTVLRNMLSTAAGIRLVVFWRLVDGTEPTNYTWTFDSARQASGSILAYSGAAITVPPSNTFTSTTIAGPTLVGASTGGTYESGMALQFFAARNTTGVMTQTTNGSYISREDTCTTTSTFVGLKSQEQSRALPVSATPGINNSCTVNSTSVCIAVFLEDARPVFSILATDEFSVNSITASTSSITTASLQTNIPSTSLVAVVMINRDATTVSSIATTGLTWQFSSRSNTQAGCVELWTAFAPTPLSPSTVTITFAASLVSVNAMILALVGADTSSGNGASAIGAVTASSSTSATYSASVVTTRNNSWVWGAINTASTATITSGTAQTNIRSQTDATNIGESRVQRLNSLTPTTGTTATINGTLGASANVNILVFEILPAQNYPLSTTGVG
jgi:hypothetical protein